jgi:two-component system nitrogen regulation response regulator NtrX
VLIVEDDGNYLYEIKEEVVAGCADLAEFHYAGTLREALRKIDEVQPDLVLLDIIFPVDAQDARADHLDYEAGVKVLNHITERGLPIQVIVLSSQSKGFAVRLLVQYKAVKDYIFKDSPWAEIRVKVRKALEALAQMAEITAGLLADHVIVGGSPAIGRVRDLIARVARKDETTVLVTGASGTGKELVAYNIHALSRRRERPFVVVNCAAIPESLLESELFGHVAGAFTGAVRETRGRFELAHRGTLFLDEIAEVPVSTQVKLLRSLQDKTVQKVGDPEPIHVDVRIVAATNRDLDVEIRAGRFREDLFYRLNVFPIHLPPLAERREDIALLAEHYLAQFNRELETTRSLTPDALAVLERCPWPGNVRELKNVLERLLIVADGPAIGPAAVEAVAAGPRAGEYSVSFPFAERDYKKVKKGVLLAFNRAFIAHHLRANDHNILKTAQAIGYNRQDLSVLIRELGLEPRRGGGGGGGRGTGTG